MESTFPYAEIEKRPLLRAFFMARIERDNVRNKS